MSTASSAKARGQRFVGADWFVLEEGAKPGPIVRVRLASFARIQGIYPALVSLSNSPLVTLNIPLGLRILFSHF
jgi:hypothetical protein